MYKNLFIVLVLLATAQLCCGQSTYRPKIAEFGIETLRNYDVKSNSESLGNDSNEVDEDRLIKAKLGIPVLIKDDRLFGLQLKYYQHQFEFDEEDQAANNDLFQHLNSRSFTSAGIRFFYQQNFRDNQQFRIIGGAELQSDVFQWNRNTTKHFISGTYSWKPSETTEFGAGVVVNHVMGITAVYPLFLVNKDISPRWNMNLTLPKSVSMRYNLNDRNFLIATSELRGWRYNLTEAVPTYQRNLMLRRVDLQFSLSWEHEIHDWLWFGLDVGYNKNLQYFVANPGDRARNALIDLRSQDAAYTKLSLFIVPPRKFFK
ncbi:MAG: DUF6268 family outer membrane beta-barrel protein [Cytophagales bacterium]|nr:DUF6268 family outer membrane beta-barrel protein [Cytophagales bacterium]